MRLMSENDYTEFFAAAEVICQVCACEDDACCIDCIVSNLKGSAKCDNEDERDE